jgi:hypothetical protein
MQSSGACPVAVTVNPLASTDQAAFYVPSVTPVALTSSSVVTYSLSVTPSVTSISPNNGSSLGGTLVTITGTNFAASAPGVTVTLNGIPCAVQTSSSTSITCITGARPYGQIAPLSVAVNVLSNGAGLAIYDPRYVYFRYLDRWSSPNTWRYQEPPVAGDSVVIPAGQLLLVDVSPPELFLVLVEGDLVFDNQDLTFDATYIFIYGGSFQAGTEDIPFLNRLTITLHGDRLDTIGASSVPLCVLLLRPH